MFISEQDFQNTAARISAVKKEIQDLCNLALRYSDNNKLGEDPRAILSNIENELTDLRRIFRDRRAESKIYCYISRCQVCHTWLGDYDITLSRIPGSGPCPGWWLVGDNNIAQYAGPTIPEHADKCPHENMEMIKFSRKSSAI